MAFCNFRSSSSNHLATVDEHFLTITLQFKLNLHNNSLSYAIDTTLLNNVRRELWSNNLSSQLHYSNTLTCWHRNESTGLLTFDLRPRTLACQGKDFRKAAGDCSSSRRSSARGKQVDKSHRIRQVCMFLCPRIITLLPFLKCKFQITWQRNPQTVTFRTQ
jgi:hypothetical protein